MITTQAINAFATFGIKNVPVTYIQVERVAGRTTGFATIKCIVEDVSDITPGTNVSLYVESETEDDAGETTDFSKKQIFRGTVYRASQDEEGLIKVEAYDIRDRLRSSSVKLEVETPRYAHAVTKDLLEDEFGLVAPSLDAAKPLIPYIAPKEDFPNNPQRPWRFGGAKRGQPLEEVLMELVKSLGGYMMVDKQGRLRITPYPKNHRDWDIPLITEIDAGENTRNADQVIFEGSGTASELGQGASYVNSQTNVTSISSIQGGEDEGPAPTKTLADDNVTTQSEADNRAFKESVDQEQNRDLGTVTIIGNSEMELYDQVVVPQLEYDIASIGGKVPNFVQEGKYRVSGLTHTINQQDGFVTKIQLTPSMEDTYEMCTVESGTDVATEFFKPFENTATDSAVSGQDDATGILSDIFSFI